MASRRCLQSINRYFNSIKTLTPFSKALVASSAGAPNQTLCRKAAHDKEKEAAEIGYTVIGPLQESDRVFKPYEPVFAVIQIGSHQFKVSNGDNIYVERLKYCDVNDKLVLNKVLMLGSQTQTIIGRPILPDAAVHAVVEEHDNVAPSSAKLYVRFLALDAKVIIFKKKRRKNYRRTRGHRQELTKLRITDVQGIEKPQQFAFSKKEKKEKQEKLVSLQFVQELKLQQLVFNFSCSCCLRLFLTNVFLFSSANPKIHIPNRRIHGDPLISTSTKPELDRKHYSIPLARCGPRFAEFSSTVVILLLFLAGAGAVGISYSDHCGDVVPDTPLLPDSNSPLVGREFFSLHRAYVCCGVNITDKDVCAVPGSLSFITEKAYRTENDTILKIDAGLRVRAPSHSLTSGGLPLMSGFWDWSSGKLCMIDPILDASSESVSEPSSISVLGVNTRNYNYELIHKEIETNGFSLLNDTSSVSLGGEDLGQNPCFFVSSAGKFELEYENACSGVNCNFLGRENNSFMPSVIYFFPLEPNVTLVSEGKWDLKQKRLNMVGCRIFSDWDEGFVGECLIRLSLRFPARWTLRERSTVVGELWSSRSVNETGYFERVTLMSLRNSKVKALGMRYEYTEIENSKRSCANKKTQKTGKKIYPRTTSSNMRFDMIVRSKKVPDLFGYSSPVYMGSQGYIFRSMYRMEQQNLGHRVNISYILTFGADHDFKISDEHKQIRSIEISAEGIYDPENGHLCMIGCMSVVPPKVRVRGNSSLDCEILIDMWYPPENGNNGQEINMVLVSNTLLCIFEGLQIVHVKRHANVLPFVSVVMLVVLSLGLLLLNFEAVFTRGRKSFDFYFGGDEWVEVTEVLVRVITMVAFLLECRLLQMTWSARSADGSQKNPWTHEKKVLYLLAPLYIGGGLIAWLVHQSRKPSITPLYVLLHYRVKEPQSLWDDLKSYGGFVMDGFLLPQFVFHIFFDTKEKALIPSFYVGTSLVRLLPHVYDLYRSHLHTWPFGYIYPNSGLDYYSTAWDIIRSVGASLLVVLIYLQQRYGGKCILARRFWRSLAYEKVPALQIQKFRFKTAPSMEILSSPPPQTLKSTAKSHYSIPLPRCSPRFATFSSTVVVLLIFLAGAGAVGISYSDHCGDVVPDTPLLPESNPPLVGRGFLSLQRAYVGCGVNITDKDVCAVPRFLSFFTEKAYRTEKDTIFKIDAVLSLRRVRGPHFSRRGLRLVHVRPPKIPLTSGLTGLEPAASALTGYMSGFWDWSSGKLCMIGSGNLDSNRVVLKLDYLNSSSIFTSLVNGTLEILDASSESVSEPRCISILGVNTRNYKYELIDKEIKTNGFSSLNDTSSVSLGVEDLGQKLCTYARSARKFELEYENACIGMNCNFLGRGNNSFMPSVMYLKVIECLDDGRVRFLLKFAYSDVSGYHVLLEPNATLVSEGKWDPKQKRFNMVGCRIFSDWDEGFVGECLIRLSLRFPARWTLRERSTVVGELWSSRSVNETGYFERVTLRSLSNSNVKAPGLRYEYTEIENTKRSCANKTTQKTGKKNYPNATSSNMRFDVIVRSKKVPDLFGYSSPVYVGSQLYMFPGVYRMEQQNPGHRVNISYILTFKAEQDFKISNEHKQIRSIEISAEGSYDPENGHLCMIGCMSVVPHKVRVRGNSSLDCEILIDVWYPPENGNSGQGVKGNIKSTRDKSDLFYFEPLDVFSLSAPKDSIWTMDMEMTMVLVSNTLLCIFVGLQIVHVKRHANVLPFVSVVMLVVLTLGHLVPLLLNFEAVFTRGRKSFDVYLGEDEWVGVNEVLVRVITMVVFLLECRLLQMTWSARSADESQKNPWTHEKKVLYLLAPLYIGGGLIAWLAHQSRKPSISPPFVGLHHRVKQPQSLWGDLKSYGGLVLDGFLLPQVVFNIFFDTKEKALVPSFYVGTSLVRLLPHVYDLYRSHTRTWSFGYIYANPRLDYYSTAWDIIISFGASLFVVLIYLQQRYGGRCILARRFWRSSAYEKVPVAGPE
ncbi:50S ribosomal protein L21 [Striga asiatica]|uniref:RING-type E3 ubiquitin transferase n=1 Tax=Striga asiatica TaxID=4170 RepID=A0A5A7NY84_STRAF|nr:50S ribosomal protein L21 [Striga asiatica]